MSDLSPQLLPQSRMNVNRQHLPFLIRELEDKVGALPEDYRAFLMQHPGGVTFKNGASFIPDTPPQAARPDGSLLIGVFFGVGGKPPEIESMIRSCWQIPKDTIPIADAPGGDLICMRIGRKMNGQIVYWTHDSPSVMGITPIAAIFSEFVTRLAPMPEPSMDDEDDGVTACVLPD